MVRPIQALTVDDAGMQDYLINWNAGPLGVVLRPDLGADMPPVVAQLLPQPSVLKLAGVREGDLLISVNGKKTTRLGYEKVVRLLFKERLPMVLHLRTPLQTTVNLQPPELRRGASASIAEESADRPRGRTRASSSARPPRGHRERSATEISGRDPRGRSTTTDHDLRARTTATERDPRGRPIAIERDSRSRITAELPPKSKKDKKKKEKGGPADERRLRKQFSVVWERGSLGLSFRAYNSKVDVPCVDFISVSRGQGRGMERVCVNDVLIAINGEKTKSLGVEKVLRWLHVIEKPVVLRFHASSNRVQGQPSDPDGLPDPAGPLDGRARRPTLPQPEYEPVPRPPRRNNSVDHGPPPPPEYSQEQAYTQERVYVDGGNYDQVVGRSDGRNYEPVEMGREYEPVMVRPDVRRYSSDSTPYYEDREPQIRHVVERPTNPRRGRRSSTDSLHVVHRPSPYDDNGTMMAGDFRREPMSDPTPPPFDLQIDARIIPHRRPPTDHNHNHNGYYQSRPERPPYQPSYQLLGGDAINHQPSASSPYKAEANDDRARPRLASRDSQASAASHLSFDEAADIVARAAGKPAVDCEFGGVPLLHIQEGTVQAKLMFIYAKACVAREQDITTDGNHDQPLESDGDVNNNGGPIKSDSEMEIPRTPGNPLGRKTHAEYLSYTILQDDALTSSVPHGRRDAPASTPMSMPSMPSMPPPQTKAPPSPGPLVLEPEPSRSISSESGSLPPPPAAPTSPVPPTEAFISLKDFVVSGDGSLTERRTTSSLNSTATPDPSADGDKLPEPQPTTTDNSETSHDSAAENPAPRDPEVARPAEEEPTEQSELLADDDAVSIGSSNERELAASVASLDDLLDLPVKNHNHDDEEHEEFVDEEEEEPTGTEDTKQKEQEATVTAPLDMQLSQVQEEAEEVEEEEEQLEDGALMNPLVDELFRNVPDVREIVKDKPALVVLVKKSMIDEIQEILQSLQMELQFERHSTMGVGSMPSPPRHSRLSALNTEGKHCFRCDAVGELAELTLAGGRRELYCQECWELFFFSEDRQSPVAAGKELAPSEASRLTADEDALDEALKYSFHDSSVTREDMIHPWRYLQGSDSMSSIRDSATSNNSSITDRTDEVWL